VAGVTGASAGAYSDRWARLETRSMAVILGDLATAL